MKKYKVGIIAKNILNKKRTGIENYTINLLKNFNLNTDYKFIVYINHKYKGKSNLNNIEFKYLKDKKAWTHTVLYKNIKNDNLDLLFSPTPTLPILKLKTKTIVTVHDLSFKYMKKQIINTTKLFIKKSLNNADQIIAVSKYTKEEIHKTFNIDLKKITTIYEAYDKNIFYPTNYKGEKDGITLISIGSINRRKNITQIVKILPILEEKYGNANLIIVGEKGDDFDNLMYTIKDFKLENKVSITGYVSDTKLKGLIDKSDVLVYPSLEEGFGLPILEGFASNIPVVTSDNSAMKEIGGRAAVLIDPKDIFDIANGVIAAIENHSKLTKLGIIEASKYSWEKTANETLSLFEKTINS
ncbi:glycosyltransferase family 4 protein [Patescibacteria group bacterium]|nr:glycosyltransferase family 4 protein [Patescibacteria group bacterium]